MPGEQQQAFYLPEAQQEKSIESCVSDSDEEVDTTNMYFVANENTSKIYLEPYLEDCDLTMEELGEAFEELSNKYDFFQE